MFSIPLKQLYTGLGDKIMHMCAAAAMAAPDGWCKGVFTLLLALCFFLW